MHRALISDRLYPTHLIVFLTQVELRFGLPQGDKMDVTLFLVASGACIEVPQPSYIQSLRSY